MPIDPPSLIPLKPEPMDIDLYETTFPPLSDGFSTSLESFNSIPDRQYTGSVLPASSPSRDFIFEDELSMNLASLALTWKPLNPDNTGTGTLNSSTVEGPSHPLFPCPIDLRQALGQEINTHEPEKSKENPSKPKRFHPYQKKPKPKPKDKEVGYIIHTTRKPEDRSKYLDPSLETTTFWQFVQQRNNARTEERREALRIAIAMSERGSVVESHSTWGRDRDDRSIGFNEIDEVHSRYGPEDEHKEDEDKVIGNGMNQSSLSLYSRMEKERSLRGVELIDTSPKKWKVSPNKNFLKRLMSNVERYNGNIKK
ncbi:hypothetical protein I203_108138 [Kwoniella mangroviensis CBS 8507]|uniref:hypothetical protein n=1 Tax=Kwoniella mangroviensis CBS 8507 TaxID=1296122 RepID=UPI00080CD732|nr:uncharacterized protein I203_05031 [Kwoniella mangroviensis CBS 8507]OCF66009.1 hypothetical protein I203_05031 [Kwoniella mangroviensis CBS 8507]